MKNYNELESLIIDWAKEKGILEKGNPLSQCEKTLEEVDELYFAIKNNDKPEIIDLLEKSYLMFDYATKFASSKESIPSASQFVLTPQMYDEFVQFVKMQKDIQSSETEKQLEQLKVKLKAKPNIESIQSSITAIEKFLYDYKLQEIQKHQTSISQLLAEEIVRRYEYQEGGFIQSFKHDQYILKSLEIFNNSMQYQQILNKK